MKKIILLVLLSCINGLTLQSALAQDDNIALVPLPSLDDFTRGSDGWSFGLGLGVEYETAYEGSDEFGLEIQPAGAVQWRNGAMVTISSTLPEKQLAGAVFTITIGC